MCFVQFTLWTGVPVYINLDKVEAVMAKDGGVFLTLVGGEDDFVKLRDSYEDVTQKIREMELEQRHG